MESRNQGSRGGRAVGDTTDPGAAEAGVGRLTGRLVEALTSLCQAGERFVDSAAEGGPRMIGVVDPVRVPRRSAREDRSRSATRSVGARPGGTATGRGAKSPPGKMERMALMRSAKGAELWRAASTSAGTRGAWRDMADSRAWCC